MQFLKIAVVCMLSAAALACATANQSNTAANSASVVNAGSSPGPAQQTESARTEAADGHKLYADNCAACHKESGTGGKMTIEGKTIKPDDLTSDKIKSFTDEKIAGYIKNGIEDEGMPSFRDKLDDKQIAAVIEYIRTDLQKIKSGT